MRSERTEAFAASPDVAPPGAGGGEGLFSRLFGETAPLVPKPSPPPPPPTAAAAAKPLGALGLALFCFASIAGGPFGIEGSVGGIGALPTMLALLLTAVTWSLTQALMAAELSSMYPSNAGNVAWVLKGLGPTAGFVNALLIFSMNVLNLPLFAALAAESVGQVVALGGAQYFLLQLAVLAVGVAINILGVAAVEKLTGFLVLLVQLPFLLMPIVWAAQKRPFEWRALGSSAGDWRQNVGPGLATVCWNSLGWNSLGNIAGEVRDGSTNIPLGFALAVVAISLNYLVPLVFTIAMAPDTAQWETGYFVAIARDTAPWLGSLAAACGVASCLNNLIPQLTMASRATQAIVRARMLPGALDFLGRDSALTGTPVAAILFNAAASLCLLPLDFEVLVVLEVLCALVGLLLQFVAFLVLKHRQPNAPRPFAVPGGLAGAYIIAVPFFGLAGMLIYFDIVGSGFSALVVGGAVAIFAAVGEFWYARDVYSGAILQDLLGDGAAAAAAAAGAGEALELDTSALIPKHGAGGGVC